MIISLFQYSFYLNYSFTPVSVVYNYVFNCLMNPNHSITTGLLGPNSPLMMMIKKKLHGKLRRTYTHRIVPTVNPVCDLSVFQVPGNTLQEIMSWNKQHLCNEIITEVSAINKVNPYLKPKFVTSYAMNSHVWLRHMWCKFLAANQFLTLYISRIKQKLNHKRWRLSTKLCLIATELSKLIQQY
jgi:hypothetical protein